jgi:hypothetical protein
MYSIRPPPAVARLAGKEKKKNAINSVSTPTSHPSSHSANQGISGIMSWGKKDTKTESKWESGVIGRERARVVIDGSYKK